MMKVHNLTKILFVQFTYDNDSLGECFISVIKFTIEDLSGFYTFFSPNTYEWKQIDGKKPTKKKNKKYKKSKHKLKNKINVETEKKISWLEIASVQRKNQTG